MGLLFPDAKMTLSKRRDCCGAKLELIFLFVHGKQSSILYLKIKKI